MRIEDIARVTHEANRAVQEITGDPVVSPEWGAAPEWQRASAYDGVQAALNGATPEELHQNWCSYKTSEGWVYGEAKDEQAKTHPCLVPYVDLPAEQRVKDYVFGAIVNALKGELS